VGWWMSGFVSRRTSENGLLSPALSSRGGEERFRSDVQAPTLLIQRGYFRSSFRIAPERIASESGPTLVAGELVS
jgi:hypothetical protein